MVDWNKALVSGIAGGIAFTIMSFILFSFIGLGEFGGPGLLLGYGQSQKFITVFTQQPLPLQTTFPLAIVIGNMVLGILYALVYGWAVKHGVPGEGFAKGINFGIILFVFSALWYELFVNISLLLVPFYLIIVELIFWLIVYSVEGIVIVKFYESR